MTDNLYTIIKDANAGNSANTYYKAFSIREYCIYSVAGNDYLRDKVGRVRRFDSRDNAQKALARGTK